MIKTLLLGGVLALGACNSKSDAADNTGRNEAKKVTADQAVDTRSDLDVTQAIRKAVVDDGSLSMNAHNVKIVVNSGKATLAGPVASDAERDRVAAIAADVVGKPNVVNQLEVAN